MLNKIYDYKSTNPENEHLVKKDIRKVQLTGGSTYMVSLPKDWIELMGLRKGSNVEIIYSPNDYSLIIKPLSK